MNKLLIPIIGLPVLLIVVGFLIWRSVKNDAAKTAVRLDKLKEKRAKIALHGAQPGDELVDDVALKDIQGTWRMVSVGRNGNFAPPEVLKSSNVKFKIDGDKFTIEPGNKAGTLKIDSTHVPAHLEQHQDNGDSHLCIVRLRNGELEICQAENGAERPETFSPNRHDNASLTRFKRIG